jgi:hypothetical protein
MPGIVAGGESFGTHYHPSSAAAAATSFNIVYGLITKTIWKLGRFTAGGYKGSLFADPARTFYKPSNPSQVHSAGVLASWDRTISEISDRLWVGVDFQSGENIFGAASFGFAWAFCPTMSLLTGMDFWNDGAALTPTVTLQLDLDFY